MIGPGSIYRLLVRENRYDKSSCEFSVRLLLKAKGLEHESDPLDVLTGEPQSEAHRALHTFGKVPVLEYGDLRIVETIAILRYLNEALSPDP